MKKWFSLFLCVLLLFSSLSLAEDGTFTSGVDMDTEGFLSSLSDWILGTDWGILSGSVDPDLRVLTFSLPEEDLKALTRQDRKDIQDAMLDMLSLYLPSRETAERFSILYQAKGAAGPDTSMETKGTAEPEAAAGSEAVPAASAGSAQYNLVFIHHSVGENWLMQGLSAGLNSRGYHVADITYGWREYGDFTDTADWPGWFTDEVMALVYGELGTMSAVNSVGPAEGENTIVLFKSCFPNSDTGDSIEDEKAVYNGLLPYFAGRPDKMFILVTPPPMVRISNPGLTRQLCRWLADRQGGWLASQASGNVFVFDLYNVLTHPDAHHWMEDGHEAHVAVRGADELYYDSDGDDHPNGQGSRKAAEEFVPLLDHWVFLYTTGSGDASQRFEP